MAKICGFYAISPCIIAKPSCSRVKRSRIIARGVAALKNSPASLQKAFTPMQNGLASSQGRFAALFHVLAVVRGTIARLFRRLFWWLWSSVASSSSAGIPHLFPFRTERFARQADSLHFIIFLRCSQAYHAGRVSCGARQKPHIADDTALVGSAYVPSSRHSSCKHGSALDFWDSCGKVGRRQSF